MKRLVLAAVCVTGLATTTPATAAVLTFDAIPVSLTVDGVFNEAGFTLDVDGLVALEESGGVELEPTCCTSGGSLTVTNTGGGNFTFSAIDLQKEYFPADPIAPFLRLEGFLGAASQGVEIFNTASSTYVTVAASVLAGQVIDRLVITGQRDLDAGIAFDNLVVNSTQVAEPASALLLGTGALVALARRRSRRSTSA